MNQYKIKESGYIVADNYHVAGVFPEFGIDLCYGGWQTFIRSL